LCVALAKFELCAYVTLSSRALPKVTFPALYFARDTHF